MPERYEIWEKPDADEIYMLAGWRQWVDGGATSSGLPRYLIQQTKAKQIGKLKPDGYYLFQLPGMQQFLRPMVRHNEGHPESLHVPRNEYYYSQVGKKGVVYFRGHEPHMDAERYVQDFLEVAKSFKVRRIVLFGGIYAEIPYDKERYITSVFSLPSMREEMEAYTVDLSNYQGPGSIGSYLCHRAGEQGIEMVGLYAFCPIYQFGDLTEFDQAIHIENDYVAWLGIMERVSHMLKLNFDLEDLERKADSLIEQIKRKVDDLDRKHPELQVQEYMQRLVSGFEERRFNPLDDIWEDELRRLGDEYFPPEEE